VGGIAMSGTGFFDNFESIDTSSEKGALNKEKKKAPAPKAEEPIDYGLPNQVPTGFQDPPEDIADRAMEAMPPEFHEKVEQMKEEFVENIIPTKAPVPQGGWMTTSTNPAWAQINAARGRATRSHKHVLCGIAGPPKSGKSGQVLDSLTEEEKAAGAEIHHIDFDAGGESTKAAHHSGSKNIVVLNPWVMNDKPSRVPYDFPASYQMTIDYLKAAIEMADKQMEYFEKHGEMPTPYLKTVVFDGADHWLNICETTMKVDDLGLGPDGIATAGKATTTQIGRFNWNIRKNRYNSALTALQELCRRGIHCYIITHMKSAYDSAGNEIMGAETPHWLRDTEGWLQQMVVVEVDEERDERGELTGVVESYAVMTQNRTSLKAHGRVKLFRRDKTGGEWYGWPGLRDGSFEHPDDVKDDSSEPSE
tara:strand:+ start:93 stop:1352 length:1260 start_codon:yes stop_codon:yes gene_type:complete